jgi:hypothetical protein
MFSVMNQSSLAQIGITADEGAGLGGSGMHCCGADTHQQVVDLDAVAADDAVLKLSGSICACAK